MIEPKLKYLLALRSLPEKYCTEGVNWSVLVSDNKYVLYVAHPLLKTIKCDLADLAWEEVNAIDMIKIQKIGIPWDEKLE